MKWSLLLVSVVFSQLSYSVTYSDNPKIDKVIRWLVGEKEEYKPIDLGPDAHIEDFTGFYKGITVYHPAEILKLAFTGKASTCYINVLNTAAGRYDITMIEENGKTYTSEDLEISNNNYTYPTTYRSRYQNELDEKLTTVTYRKNKKSWALDSETVQFHYYKENENAQSLKDHLDYINFTGEMGPQGVCGELHYIEKESEEYHNELRKIAETYEKKKQEQEEFLESLLEDY